MRLLTKLFLAATKTSLPVDQMNPSRLSLATAGMVLLLVMTRPVTGAPGLSQGARSSYNLDASLSIVSGPNCTPTPQTVCPMIASTVLDLDLNGTVGWNVTSANKTSVNLNVTSLLLTRLNFTRLPTLTFAESVNLTNRLVSFPSPRFILNNALSSMLSQVQSALPLGCDSCTVISDISGLPNPLHKVYTMWWVNGPLSLGERVPILTLPPLPVLHQEIVDLGSLGTRTAWVVGLESTSIVVPPGSTTTSPTGGVNATTQLLFYYDTKSDLLLKSTASLHLLYPMSASNSLVIKSVEASFTLTLASTSVSLDEPVSPSSTSRSSSSDGSSQGASGQSTSSNSQSSGSTGSQPGGSITQSSNLSPANSWPWVYAVLGVVVVVIASVGAWTLRRRRVPLPNAPYPAQ
jgi:hypothetical protein